MKKVFCLLFLLLFSVPYAAAETEITVWAMGAEGKLIRKMADRFEEEHPGITVKTQAIPWSGAHEKMVTAVVGDMPPDVCQMGTTWMSEFAVMQSLENLDGYLEKSATVDPGDFFDGSLYSNRFQENYIGVPWYVDTRVIFYRKDIIKKAGFPRFPETWPELKSLSRAIMKYRETEKIPGYAINLPANDWNTFLIFLWQNGGDVLQESLSASALDSDAALEALEFYKNFFDEKFAPLESAKDVDIFNAFESGFFPVFISGPWMISEIERNTPGLKGLWTTSRMPKKKNYASFIGGCNLVMFRASKNKAASWKFIEFMSRPENQAQWYEISKNLPANRLAWEWPSISGNEHLAAFKEQLVQAKAPPNIPEWERLASIISESLEEAMYGKTGTRESLAKMDQRIDAVLAGQHGPQSPGFKITVTVLIVLSFVIAIAWYLGKQDARDRLSLKKYSNAAYIFILPTVCILLIFLFLPIITSFIMSLTNWNIYAVNNPGKIVFTGLENYIKLFRDPVFWISLKNTMIFTIFGVPLNILLALVTAVLLNQHFIRLKALFRVGFFLPVITTTVAVAVIWRWLYNPEFGIFNWALGLAGIAPQSWLADTALALPSLIVMGVWKGFGYNMIIFVAALQSIPDSLYEAADIDGADKVQQFIHITVPMLRRTTFFIVIMTTIGYLQFFAEPYIMTDGGPLNSTMSVVLYMYRQGFKFYNLGYASSIAYILFAIICVFTFFQFRLSRKFDM